jgi:outer membrane protein insertion porin family
VFFLLIVIRPTLVYAADKPFSEKACPVRQIEVRGLHSISKSELVYLLNIDKGCVIDRSALSAGVRRAFLLGIFEDIIIESLDPDNTAIVVTVKEKPVIGSIAVKENEHFSTNFIKKELHFVTGDRLNGLKIKDGIAEVNEAMHRRGFVNADAAYAVIPGKKNTVSIEIVIYEGQPETIKQIIIPSHADIINNYLKLSANSIFDLEKMDEFKSKILNSYKKQNFVGTSLSYTYQSGVLTINFDPGKRLTVTFSGNNTIGSGDLMKEVTFFEINEISDDLIEETVAGILTLYHRNGFIFAQAVPVVSTTPETMKLEIFISEGDRYKVGTITFEGATIPQDRLRAILVSKTGDYYSPEDLDSDKDALTDFYLALGYLHMEVQGPEISMQDKNVDLKYVINEKQQVKIANMKVAGTKFISSDELIKILPLKIGSPYNEVDILDSQRKIIEVYNNRGFLEAKVKIDREITDATANIVFNVSEGDRTFFGKDIFLGLEKTKVAVIERELTHKMDAPFDNSELAKERQRLYRLGLFTEVQVVPSEKNDSTRDILYKFREADAGAVDYGVGYGEYEKYRGFVGVSYKNLFGMDRQASFRAEVSSLEKRFILSYSEPYFLDRELTFKSSLLYENKREFNIDTKETSYRLTRETASAGVEKKLSDTLKGALNYDFSVVATRDVQPDIILTREDTGTLIISGVRPGLIYDTRDNPFDPAKGILAGASLKTASSFLFSQTDFFKLQGYVNNYQRLSKSMVLAVSFRSGVAKGFNHTSELPLVERFFLGGRTTVRGYDQDTLGPKGVNGTPLGGDAFVMGNFELRTDVGRGFGVVTFVDTGDVWEKTQDINLGQLKFTTGLGLRYKTPVGPLSVDYGVKLSREKGESLGAIHFSIGQAF